MNTFAPEKCFLVWLWGNRIQIPAGFHLRALKFSSKYDCEALWSSYFDWIYLWTHGSFHRLCYIHFFGSLFQSLSRLSYRNSSQVVRIKSNMCFICKEGTTWGKAGNLPTWLWCLKSGEDDQLMRWCTFCTELTARANTWNWKTIEILACYWRHLDWYQYDWFLGGPSCHYTQLLCNLLF